MSEACANPVCSNLIPSEGENEWRRTPKKFCSDECRTDAWAIRRTRKLLAPLSEDKQQEILFGDNYMQQHGIGERNQHAINIEKQRKTNGDNQRSINGAPHESGERKIYRSSRFPSYTIRNRVRFNKGVFETEDAELQRLVEENDWYGVHILRDE
jgi:hypothetical protein